MSSRSRSSSPRSKSPSPKSSSSGSRSRSRSHGRARSPISRSSSGSGSDTVTSGEESRLPATLADLDQMKQFVKRNKKGSSPSPPPPHIIYKIDATEKTISFYHEGDITLRNLTDDALAELMEICNTEVAKSIYPPRISELMGNPNKLIVNANYTGEGTQIIRIHEIFKALNPKATLPKGFPALPKKTKKGGSRRRPSRKYKKSKRVMRRKSRSTRRR